MWLGLGHDTLGLNVDRVNGAELEVAGTAVGGAVLLGLNIVGTKSLSSGAKLLECSVGAGVQRGR